MASLPLVVAHDGCEGTLPHTVESARRGLAAGADLLEVDIRSTKDGVVVLRHDASLWVDGEEVAISELAFAELQALQASGRLSDREPVGRITRLEEVLEPARRGGVGLNLDVKEDAVIDAAVRVVRLARMSEQVLFSGCEAGRARAFKSRHRALQVLLNLSEGSYRIAAADYGEFVRSVCEEAVEAGCCGLNLHHSFCREELVFGARRRFLPVSVWTVDDEESMSRLLDLGVFSITTKRVSALRALMARRADRPASPQA